MYTPISVTPTGAGKGTLEPVEDKAVTVYFVGRWCQWVTGSRNAKEHKVNTSISVLRLSLIHI